ncbi:hypothetical protein [Shewanella sp. MEBiC00475]|uniref:hypothetical protein n=1 Tax=Shewanella sp. MEBiC00475 TaxID=2575361 RepID=UPI0010BF7DF1|nr:hypothetical protein [Shewanella sp. MEBiC00475]
MVDLVLHPGHSKCGSTTIQDFLYANRELFRSRGIFLPDLNFNFPCHDEYQFQLTHTPRDYLARVQSGEVDISELSKKIDDLINKAEEMGCRRVIISAENLINAITSKMTSAIHQLFAEKFNKVRIVYYVRRQDTLLLAAWQQWGHKDGYSLNEYVSKLAKTKFADFNFIATKLRQFYTDGVLKVFPLERKYLTDENLLTDFCTRAVINKAKLNFDIQSSNAGISSALCDTLSKINNVYINQHDQNIKNSIISSTPNAKNIISKKYSLEMSNETREILFTRFQESNEALAKRFFPNVPFDNTMSLTLAKGSVDNDMQRLMKKIEKLEDINAIQMDMILQLMDRVK